MKIIEQNNVCYSQNESGFNLLNGIIPEFSCDENSKKVIETKGGNPHFETITDELNFDKHIDIWASEFSLVYVKIAENKLAPPCFPE